MYKLDTNNSKNEAEIAIASSYDRDYMKKMTYYFLHKNGRIPQSTVEVNCTKEKEKLDLIIPIIKEMSKIDYSITQEIMNDCTEIIISAGFVAIRLFFHDHYETTDLKNIIKQLEDEDEYYHKIHGVVQFSLDKIENKNLKKFIHENFISSQSTKKQYHEKEIGMFTKNGMGDLSVVYSPLNPKNESFNFDDLYNDDFKEIHENIMHNLTEADHGLILLHGAPGTGKTSYIRSLIREERIKKNIIYMPPFMTQMLGSPEFMNFLMKSKNNIYIIEDAETALKTREAGGNEAVANVLNASDGIMGDVIKSQFIFTFNCQDDEIDPALTRPGRLLEQYEFTNLTEDKTQTLWKKVNGDNVPPKKEMSLAEIFNHNTTINTKEKEESEKPQFGFMGAS